MLEKYIDPWVLGGAFVVGFLVVCMMSPTPQVIMKFPNPHNAKTNVYKTDYGECFRYKATNSTCPADPSKIVVQPIMEDYVSHK